jgi:hypothetical protein
MSRPYRRLRRAASASPPPSYMAYYNGVRTHLSLDKDAPVPRTVQAIGRILPTPILCGLHHHYVRI